MAQIAHLVVDQYGAFLGKHSGRLRVSVGREKVAEAPLLHLEQVLITGRGVSLSADAVQACCEEGIPIHFLSPNGTPYAGLYSSGLMGTVQTRRAQIAAYLDGRGVTIAKRFAAGKIMNQAALLKYMAKYRKEADPDLHREMRLVVGEVRDHLDELERLSGSCVEEVREQILSIEGRAAHRYWTMIQQVLPPECEWPGRERRGAKDAVNAALNYGYGILYSQVEWAIVLAGLDPYAGFIHSDRPGKPSLVLDLIEEFRVPAVDRTIFGLVNKRVAFDQDEEGLLTAETRRALAGHVLDRLDKPEKYEGRHHPLRAIVQMQARHLATFLRGDRPVYGPFIARW